MKLLEKESRARIQNPSIFHVNIQFCIYYVRLLLVAGKCVLCIFWRRWRYPKVSSDSSLMKDKPWFFQEEFQCFREVVKNSFKRFHVTPKHNLEVFCGFRVVCSLKKFSKKCYLGIDRMSHSEQLFPLELLLKMRDYLSGNRRIFGKMSDIFAHKPYF